MKTFKFGGIHPKQNKLTAGKTAQKAIIPDQVIIPLLHYIGSPSIPIVSKGDVVKTGQLIGKADGYISANVHTPISGTVVKIDDVLDASGYKHPAVFINVEGDVWLESINQDSEIERDCALSGEEIIQKIIDAGIVGLGGATFPTHVKLIPPADKKAEVLLINGVECEPYLTCDHQLMLEKSEEILIGIRILMKAVGVNRAIIGIENNKEDAINQLKSLINQGNYYGIEVLPLKIKYPQGGEKQLIEAALNRRIPGGKLPVEVGAIVQNVGTAFAVYEAVQKNKPLIERMITITGKSVANPGNFWTRLGIPLASIVEQAGGIPENTGKIIAGGPMMGRALTTLDIPVAKGTAGVLFIPSTEAARNKSQNCIRCATCVSACPMKLEPYLLMSLNERNMNKSMVENHILDCIECGCCSYVCPSNRPLLDHIRVGKSITANMIRSNNIKI